MKRIYLLSLALVGMAMTSCNDFLDKLPDDRAELSSVEKIKNLLVSAYPTHTPAFMLTYSSDEVTDNGSTYTAQPNQDKLYHWEDVETTGNDDPKGVWGAQYGAIATANHALEAIEKLGDTPEMKPLKAEALLCRAYAAFVASYTFCMAYDPTKADEYLGVPYPKVPGVETGKRGTLAETYANINADIEEALPMLDDSYLVTPKYHFNTKAAYAFAARFNLYYHKYDKAIEYATKALGENPSNQLRKFTEVEMGYGADDYSNHYVMSNVTANYMLQTAYSINGRDTYNSLFRRYSTNMDVCGYELWWAYMPWSLKSNTSGNNCLYEAHQLYGSAQSVYYPKMDEFFEVTDKVAQTGFAHTIDAVFTAEECLMVRAEAEALSKKFDDAVADINIWYNGHCSIKYGSCTRKENLTAKDISDFFDKCDTVPSVIVSVKQRGVKKPLHPQGFTVEEGTMKNLIYMILQIRRLETWHQGLRFLDIKRYGIEFSHNFTDADPILFKAGDLRGALQLPIDVIDAGLEPNPRK